MKTQDQNIFAKVLADSACNGHRLTTMHVRCPRIILAEFNTHRALSRNSASSRAVPTAKFRERVRADPYFPQQWNIAGKGMSAAGPMPEPNASTQQRQAKRLLEDALHWHADCEASYGTAKEQLNRYLEPWLYTDILVSSTEWRNFFFLRCDPAADPAMQTTADAMLAAYVGSEPDEVEPGTWHLPFAMPEDALLHHEDQIKVCVARCARVSYFNFGEDGKVDHEADLRTYGRLRASLHLSPFEHCAQAMGLESSGAGRTDRFWTGGPKAVDRSYFPGGRSGNFVGWRQHREDFAPVISEILKELDLGKLLAERKEAV